MTWFDVIYLSVNIGLIVYVIILKFHLYAEVQRRRKIDPNYTGECPLTGRTRAERIKQLEDFEEKWRKLDR